jgi:hypothetical protein
VFTKTCFFSLAMLNYQWVSCWILGWIVGDYIAVYAKMHIYPSVSLGSDPKVPKVTCQSWHPLVDPRVLWRLASMLGHHIWFYCWYSDTQ